jgi:hypothetical protein
LEKALRDELNKIPEINNKIYPTNAPEGEKAPYLVYMTRKRPGKDLNGITKDRECYVMLNVLCNSYDQMKNITKKVEELVITFPLRNIGQEGLYVQDLTMDETTETYEPELKLQRGLIPFKIKYKEE